MTYVNGERLRTLSYFIRSQANLTDKNPPQVGPGNVQLNHEEALLCADALDGEIRYREGRELAQPAMDELLKWALDEWMDASEEVAMTGGTGSMAAERLKVDPLLQRSCKRVDHWKSLCAILRELIETPGTVTVQTNEAGECVAVTRTDDEHRILSVLWERDAKPQP